MSTATAATRPPSSARPYPARPHGMTRIQHTSHVAVTGTSLIGCIASIRATGLEAIHTAAMSAASAPDRRSASAAVAQTTMKNETAGTSDAAIAPPSACSGAMSSGNPGA